MNLKEAQSILELSSDVSPEEVKKRYRELSKKMHPDINKAPDAEEKFKKINEAYQVITSGKSTDREEVFEHWNPFSHNAYDFNMVQEIQAEPIHLSKTISFKESVLGCKQEIKYNRHIKCTACNGKGQKKVNNGCEHCGGKGQVVQQMRGMIMVQTCPKCHGKSVMQSCVDCNSTGTINSETSVSVSIPGGIKDGNILRLSGMGNFAGNFGPIEQNTDVFLQISVIPEPGLSLQDNNVISKLEISLLEALTGCQKSVKTIMGTQEITIKPLSRNKEEIIIPQLGVNKKGDQIVILDVKYPNDTTQLINILS